LTSRCTRTAGTGSQRVRVDFDLTAGRRYQFSVYRSLFVGLGDVTVELNTWLNEDGGLVVEQQLINNTKQRLSFNCLLFAPNRRRLRQQLFDIGPGRTTRAYLLANGKELTGKTLWLRVEQLGGDRLLNEHVIAEP